VLLYYELDMVRREVGGVLQHYNPLAGHPILLELARWVREGHEAIGEVHQVSYTREVAGASRASVLGGLARDVELLAAVAEDIRQVSAIGPQLPVPGGRRELEGEPVQFGGDRRVTERSEPSYATLQVQMSTESPATVRWSVAPGAGGSEQVELALIGERGTIIWRQSPRSAAGVAQCSLRVAGSHGEDGAKGDGLMTLPPYEGPLAAIRRLAAAVAETDAERRAAASTLGKATQAMEVVDAVELSLQKGRTIEVHQQQLTPQLAFRGTMAAAGCGLLLLTTLVLFAAAILGAAELLQKPIIAGWYWAVLAVLALFLLLQVVPLLSSRERPRAAGKDTDESLIDEAAKRG
jgi:predicted dehydrogenase